MHCSRTQYLLDFKNALKTTSYKNACFEIVPIIRFLVLFLCYFIVQLIQRPIEHSLLDNALWANIF